MSIVEVSNAHEPNLAGRAVVDPVRGRGRPSALEAEAISKDIIDSATRLFLENGFEGTSMEAVARAAQIPKTTLYKRFADKTALLHSVLDARLSTWSRIAAQEDERLTGDLRQRLCHYVVLMLQWATTDEVRAFSRLAASAAQVPGERSRLSAVVGYDNVVAILERDIIAYGPGAGIGATDARRVATLLMAMISGWLAMRPQAGRITKAEAMEQAEYFVAILIDGRAAW